MLVDFHNLNLATTAGEDMSDHLKYFTEHLPSTYVYVGISVERSGLFTGVRGKQIAGRCVLVNTGLFPTHRNGKVLSPQWKPRCGYTTTNPAASPALPDTCTTAPAE